MLTTNLHNMTFGTHTVFTLNTCDIGDLLDIQQSGHARQKALPKGRVGGNDVGEPAILDVIHEQRGIVFRETLNRQDCQSIPPTHTGT